MRRPQLPANFFKFSPRARLRAVQEFICSFEYKHTGQTSFNAHKFRPLARIIDTAKLMIYAPQPIKCVEAVFLAVYLTSGLFDVERIPLGFKTLAEGQVHQHIVLLVRYAGKFGAFGISRLPDLMNKELEFESISSIVGNFVKAYQHSLHTVLKIRVGLPVEHNVESCNYVCWRFLSLDLASSSWPECCEALEKHVAQGKQLWQRWLLEGKGNGAHPAFSFLTKAEDNVNYSKQTTTDTVSQHPEALQSVDIMPSKASELAHGKKLHSAAKRQFNKNEKSKLISVRKILDRSKVAAAKKPLMLLNSTTCSSDTSYSSNNNNNHPKKGAKKGKATISDRKFCLKSQSIGLLQISGNRTNPACFVRKKRNLCTVIVAAHPRLPHTSNLRK